MEPGKDPKNIRGLKIRSFNYCMILLAMVLYAFTIYATVQISVKYDRLIKATEDYVACEKYAAQVAEASDYLTEQVRLYVITGQPEYARNYFTEANVTRRRENALTALSDLHSSNAVTQALQSALDASNSLMDREIRAMQLVAATATSTLTLPAEVQPTLLSPADMALTKAQKLSRAENLVFDASYQEAKATIDGHVEQFLSGTLAATRQGQADSTLNLHRQIGLQRLFISFLVIMNIVTFLFITMLIVKPLSIYIQCIKDDKLFDIMGAYEFKYLAITYNDIYELNVANQLMLRQSAEHDALTGLMNRRAFDQLTKLLQERDSPLALLIIDVDKFKSINDQYGHEMGDRALQRVAELLSGSFRNTDQVVRLGGDEFAVLAADITQAQKELIRGKIRAINDALQSPQDDLPPLSLSVGGAFSAHGYHDRLYSQADSALYQVKERGRRGCAFYEDVEGPS